MEEQNSANLVVQQLTTFLNELPSVTFGNNALGNTTLKPKGYETMVTAFKALNLEKALKNSNLDLEIEGKEAKLSQLKEKNIQYTELVNLTEEINRQKKELKELELKNSSLVDIIGSKEKEGTIINLICKNLDEQINHLGKQRDSLHDEVQELEQKFNEKETILIQKKDKKIEEIKATEEIAKLEASKRVKLINQFSDFLAETNKNMGIYAFTMIALVTTSSLLVIFSVPPLLNAFKNYDKFLAIKGHDTTWHILNYALGLFIVKLPWAICITIVITGFYSLLKALLITYEKINQEKRNMSAIYAISGNVASSLNEKGLILINDDFWKDLNLTKEQIDQARENTKWNRISEYFSKMQDNKKEVPQENDQPKLQDIRDLLNKVIERIPKN